METFALILIAAVPALYGLFWWLDYRWLARQRDGARAPDEADPDDSW